ncbi:DUF3016 domain-containing protein [Lacimicrobium alkaliphilum]|uniref:DUF3016 domain-containing protein n=1 Tax=Lacimicrobium alkaliphilum TaxID=1526571 RepID=A0ABQ1RH81_9ALTE|nr:DUF3016 domain-containing protein [Lacimicrobium alkaliphilum]GGD70268.1 hypothetical protein GCM10011357_26660 [Lacimicrobium alkaliphilum]
MKTLLTILTLSTLAASGHVQAKADVEVTWHEPENYTDIRAANASRTKFRERTTKELQEYINELSESLPDGYKLTMTVTDLDLAGQVWPGSFVGLNSASDVRLIKRIDIPRITFEYKLMDAQGQTLKQEEEVKLKDMSFQDKHNPFFDSEPLRYEKNMLREWFRDTFAEYEVAGK